MTTETQSVLDLARNIARNSRATLAKNTRNNRPDSEADLLRCVAPDEMPSRPELAAICRRAVADFPSVPADRLLAFLLEAQDPAWATERAARQLAKRMHEGLIHWRTER